LIGEFVDASAFAVPAPQGLVDRARAFGGFGVVLGDVCDDGKIDED
jgi:hypothetical protein